MEQILNFDAPLDVQLFDRIVNMMYNGSPQDIRRAQDILSIFEQHQDAWQRVDKILGNSGSPQAKFLALQILEKAIDTKWKILEESVRKGIRDFISDLVIRLASDEQSAKQNRQLINKANHTLIQIVKQDWPHNWPTFVPDLVKSSTVSESLCENNLYILCLLSEEVFDFSSGQMTQAKTKHLKETLNSEFQLIFELCQQVLTNSQNVTLVQQTLKTLIPFLSWIPIGYIFETQLIDLLGGRLFPVPECRNLALRCLTEIASLDVGVQQYHPQFLKLFAGMMAQLKTTLPLPTSDFNALTRHFQEAHERGSAEDEAFLVNLALFFTGFFRAHLQLVETNRVTSMDVIHAHKYLIAVSNIDHKENFKTCLEYWLWLAEDLYTSWKAAPAHHADARRSAYAEILSDCRKTMIRKMVKPEEVIIVEDEHGEIVKETLPDVDAQQLYSSMRELLVFLTHLDADDTEKIMLDILSAQLDRTEQGWNTLNTLCWAVGSISGAMVEDHERRFLVAVIKDLLHLCETSKGKENKAVIASNIMYVVGQYPRFLRAHWKFLRTVAHKLFEFMHEAFAGVQEMAVDTFLKLCSQCSERFVAHQPGEPGPFVDELLNDLRDIIRDLDQPHIHVFYEAVGLIIAAAPDNNLQHRLVARLMGPPNSLWESVISRVHHTEYLRNPEVMQQLASVLRTNVRACRAVRGGFFQQVMTLFPNMIQLYGAYAEMITREIATHGPQVAKFTHVRGMRIVKREVLRLMQEAMLGTPEPDMLLATVVPPLLGATLLDYKNSVPDARDAQVLMLMSTTVTVLQHRMMCEVGPMLDATLEVTLAMITRNFEDYPEHRINFFKLLRTLNAHCFPAFLAAAQLSRVIIDSIVWAFKHTERNIAEAGLTILYEFLQQVQQSDAANQFYQAYYCTLVNEVFAVLTDTLHKPGIKLQCAILQHLVRAVATNSIGLPLAPDAGADNVAFLRRYLVTLLGNFPNLSQPQIEAFVRGAFELSDDAKLFKAHVRDFLIQLKEFAAQSNADLFEEEEHQRRVELRAQRAAAVPGLAVQQPLVRAKDEEMLD
eukprot:TRINITY_DN24503_c0_g1_i1.p1 TRINITY_DN24503_c0_g1~~TRINITY_DN24503_c0_g1_i1.p1  ORF type:complete len:1057 (-),score=290.97 TRINITY_DN24503_c0_g1_i1:3-3173(-)